MTRINILESSTLNSTEKGEPYLLVSSTSSYNWLYSDAGSGAGMSVSLYRPAPTDTTFFIVGDYAQPNFKNPTGISMILKAINDEVSPNPLLKSPVRYEQIWNDHGTGGKHDGSIWQPIPPDGYVALGSVGQAGYSEPAISNYMCVRLDLVARTTAGDLIWNDKGSGGSLDVSLYSIVGDTKLFAAQPDYKSPSGTYFQLKSQ